MYYITVVAIYNYHYTCSLAHEVDYFKDTSFQSVLSPRQSSVKYIHSTLKYFVCWTLCFVVDYLPDTLLRSKLSPGHFNNLKQTIPSQGGQSTSRCHSPLK